MNEIIYKSKLKQRLEMMIDKRRSFVKDARPFTTPYSSGYINALNEVIKEFCV